MIVSILLLIEVLLIITIVLIIIISSLPFVCWSSSSTNSTEQSEECHARERHLSSVKNIFDLLT